MAVSIYYSADLKSTKMKSSLSFIGCVNFFPAFILSQKKATECLSLE